jgi:uncharacterized protein (TIGR02145 family)
MEEGECFFTDENGDSCVIEGCTIEGACNYDPAADIYDGSCEFESCLGCTDSEACNYDETALYDDGTCIYYVDCNGTCGGNWIEDACGNCYEFYPQLGSDSVEFVVSGASNNPTATISIPEGTTRILIECHGSAGEGGIGTSGGNGSSIICELTSSIPNELHCDVAGGPLNNFKGGQGGNGPGNCSSGQAGDGGDGSAIWISDSGEIEYVCIAGGGGGGGNRYCNNGGPYDTNPSGDGGDSGLIGLDGQYGGCSYCASGFNPPPGQLDTGGKGGGTETWGLGGSNSSCPELNGFPASMTDGGNGASGQLSVAGGGGGGGLYGGGGGASGCTGNGYWGGGGGGGSSYLAPFATGEIMTGAWTNNSYGEVRIICIINYTPDCDAGCTHPQACNYNPDSNFDDGSCDYCFCGEGTQWVDSLQACMVTEAALMQACGEGTYWDDLAQACLTIETCQEDLDGDGVIGVNDLLDLLSSFGSECAPEPETAEWTCGDVVNYHGYDYNTVLIGGQCWFAENLRTQNYSNGDAINTGLNGPEWANASSGAVTLYGEDPSPSCIDYSPTVDSCDPNEALPAFGRIYNWHAVGDPRGLCPAGWHVPSDNDFMELEVFMGIDADEVQGSGWRGTTEGDQLKTETGWHNGGNGSNLYGFDLRPAGARGTSGQYDNAGRNGYLWTSTSPQENSAFYRRIEAGNSQIARGSYVYVEGYPARCLKDTE